MKIFFAKISAAKQRTHPHFAAVSVIQLWLFALIMPYSAFAYPVLLKDFLEEKADLKEEFDDALFVAAAGAVCRRVSLAVATRIVGLFGVMRNVLFGYCQNIT